MKECPSSEVLERFASGQLAEARTIEVRDHVVGCDACKRFMLGQRPTISMTAAAEGSHNPTQVTPIEPAAPVGATDRSLEPLVEDLNASAPTLSLGNKFSFLQPATRAGDLGRLGAYRILRVLGEGGMGIVFKAEDPLLERPVALKVMKPEGAADEVSRKRFLMEGKLAASVRHDHIVAIYQVDDTQGVPFLAMEFLEGEPLDRRLKRDGKQSTAEVLRLGREVAEGLAAAHDKGLVHRDIKPANIWMEKVSGKPDRAKILDFGLARGVGDKATHLTRTGVIMGTPDYMAPEQARGTELDARCDLFSLGCVLYHAATGRKPFHGDDVMATLLALATEEPMPMRQINPDIPWEVEERIRSLMAKNAGDRPKDARAVVEELTYLERNLDRLDAPRSGPPMTPNRPVIPGGPRPTARKGAPRRTVNPNASVDELLRSPPGEKPASSSPPPESWRAKPPAPSVPTAPLETNELSPWSGEARPITPAKPPRRADTAAPSPPAPPPAKPLPLPLPPPSRGIDPNIPLTGKCPKCGSSRYGKSSLGWCQVCGFSVAGPQAGEDIAGIQERYRAEQSKTWVWTMLLGMVGIFAASLVASHFLQRDSREWTIWVWMQFSSGAGSFLFSFVWAYVLVWQYHDSSQTFLPMFLTPVRFAHAVLKQSFRTKHAVCFGAWGLSATLAIFYVVGDPSFWWTKDKMNVPLQVIKLDMTPTPEHKGQKLKCQVIGYKEQGGRLVAVLLAERRDGKYHYAGTATRVSNTASNNAATATLPAHRRALPVTAVPAVTALWVDPVLGCTVEFDERTDGVLVDPIVIAWEKK